MQVWFSYLMANNLLIHYIIMIWIILTHCMEFRGDHLFWSIHQRHIFEWWIIFNGKQVHINDYMMKDEYWIPYYWSEHSLLHECIEVKIKYVTYNFGYVDSGMFAVFNCICAWKERNDTEWITKPCTELR